MPGHDIAIATPESIAIEIFFHNLQSCLFFVLLPPWLTAPIIWVSNDFTSEPALFAASASLRSVSHFSLILFTFPYEVGVAQVCEEDRCQRCLADFICSGEG